MIERYWGNNEWYLNGKLHRDDGPAIYSTHGVKKWYKHGLIHREGGPAIEYVDVKYYLQNDKYHRIDGPAVVYYDGEKNGFYKINIMVKMINSQMSHGCIFKNA